MFVILLMLGIAFFVILIIFLNNILLPKLKLKYILYKKQKLKKQRKDAFKNKIKELEIK
ncbi:MAG: hypothetical protein Q4D02_07755 [Clostridia bacterium]|nr:hypothetical protein [Clostridia bacterium]